MKPKCTCRQTFELPWWKKQSTTLKHTPTLEASRCDLERSPRLDLSLDPETKIKNSYSTGYIIKMITDTYFKCMFKRTANSNIYYRKWVNSPFFTDFDWGDQRNERYWGLCFRLYLAPAICLSLKIIGEMQSLRKITYIYCLNCYLSIVSRRRVYFQLYNCDGIIHLI